MHDLSEELAISIGGASKVVDKLERNGLAARRAHPEDRRSTLISLTPAGRRATREGERAAQRFISRILGESGEVDPLAEGLRRLQDRLDHATPEVAS